MKVRHSIHIAIAVMLLTGACENKKLWLLGDAFKHSEVPVKVNIIWDDADSSTTLPHKLTVWWYEADSKTLPLISEFGTYGGKDRLYTSSFKPLCMSYYDNSRLLYRHEDSEDNFEIFFPPRTGYYGKYASPVPGEPIVMELAPPYTVYADTERSPITIDTHGNGSSLSAGGGQSADTIYVEFRPTNIIDEFAFLIYGVEGTENMVSTSGAISGMAASYYPNLKQAATTPSTILFDRIQAYPDGQKYAWTDKQKAAFAAIDPHWDNETSGWTGQWLIGKFSAFGFAENGGTGRRLTIDALTAANNYYYAYWDIDFNAHGSGVFDIVISNRGKLIIPDETHADQNGGFQADTDGWNGKTVPIGDN